MSIFLKNIPFFALGLAVFIVLVLFVVGLIFVKKSKSNQEKKEKGRKLLAYSLYGFFIVFLVGLSFLTFNYFLEKWSLPKVVSNHNDFPPSPIPAKNVPFPRFIKIGNYFFNGPWPLRKENIMPIPTVYAILCQNNGKYAIIYLGGAINGERSVNLLKSKEYKCWLDNCQKSSKNLYVSFFRNYSRKYTISEARSTLEYLRRIIKSPCQDIVLPENKK